MAKHTIKITFEGQEGALLRLLGLIQRRCFTVESIQMPETADLCKTVTIAVNPMDTFHRIDNLKKQIERLQEVRAVEIVDTKAAHRVPSFLRKPAATFLHLFPHSSEEQKDLCI
jgi:acetolactate synthase regulatory subunit